MVPTEHQGMERAVWSPYETGGLKGRIAQYRVQLVERE
jgi:hypothetical protein